MPEDRPEPSTAKTATEIAVEQAEASGQVYALGKFPSPPNEWPEYRKTSLTRATRIQGPFVVQTSEGPLVCHNGYLAVDARGYPYPIAADEFVQIYEAAQPQAQLDFDKRVVEGVTVELREKIAVGKAQKIMADAGMDLGQDQRGQRVHGGYLKQQVEACSKALERFEQLQEAGEGLPYSRLEVVTPEIETPPGPDGPPAA